MITNIDARRIEYQSNIKLFFWDYNNLIKAKLKWIMKTNSKSIKYWVMRLINNNNNNNKPKTLQLKEKKLKDDFKKIIICIVIKPDLTQINFEIS